MTTQMQSRARPARKSSGDQALVIDGVSVHFGAFTALTDVSVEVWPGEVVGVIGPNGAGKSTLVNALAGVVPHTGQVLLKGRTLGQERPVRRAHLGLVRTFQTAQLFGSLSVRSNVELARRGRRSVARDALVEYATDLLRIDRVQDQTADKLSGGQRKLVELVRALAAEPQVLLLDEPVAGVPMRDRSSVLDLMRRQVAETGASVLLIEHDMEFISSVCDWIYVMNAGSVIADGTWNDISNNPAVLEAYLGSGTTSSTPVDD